MTAIRTSHKSGFLLRNGVQRRQTQWVGVTETSTTLAAANSSALISLGNAALLADTPFTIVRTRLTWYVRSDQTAALEGYQTAIGMGVFSDAAIQVGVASLPTPFTDLGSDAWLMHETIAGVFIFISGVGIDPVGGILRQLDSKAMRKVEDGDNIAIVGENSGNAFGSVGQLSGRFLIKLH